MRYFLPLSLVVSLGFVSCRKEAEVAPVDDQEERQLELVALKEELAKLENQLVSEQNDRFREKAEQAAIFAEMTAMMKELKEASKPQAISIPIEKVGVPAVKEEEDHAEERRLSRLTAEGEELAHLKTTSGDEYHELVITRVTDIGVVFRHRGGIARIPFAELPVAWQDRFYYDRDRALLALKNERVAEARYDRAVEASLADMEEKEARKEIDESLQRLAGAVDDLQRQAAAAPGPIDGGIIVNPPIIVHDNGFVNDTILIEDDFYCPPVIYPPIVRTPHLKVPTIRNGNAGHLEKPRLHQPTPLRQTPGVKSSNSQGKGASSAVPRSRPTTRSSTPTPTPTPAVRRPASRPTPSSTPVQRSRPAPAVQRQSTPAPVPRSSPASRPSRPAPATPTRSRPTIRRR